MVGIVCSSSFHWYYINDSRKYITNIKRNSRTLYLVSKIHKRSNFQVFPILTKKSIQVSGNEKRKIKLNA